VPDDPEPKARFVGFGDSALEYTLVCWVHSPEQEGKVKHRLNREIYKRFDENGIEIPYNTHDVNLYRADTDGARAPPEVKQEADVLETDGDTERRDEK